jgi:hypothetical protein
MSTATVEHAHDMKHPPPEVFLLSNVLMTPICVALLSSLRPTSEPLMTTGVSPPTQGGRLVC